MLKHILGLRVGSVINWLFNLVLVICLLFIIGLLGYQTGDRALPIDVRKRTIINPVVAQGDDLLVEQTLVWTKECSTHTDRYLYDGANVRSDLGSFDYATSSAVSTIGTEETFTIKIKIPIDAAPGPAVYATTTSYRCNLIQRFWPLIGPTREIHFEIVEANPTALQERISKEVQDMIIQSIPSQVPSAGPE